MELLQNNKDKIMEYYKKTKLMHTLILACEDSSKILALYDHYFTLLNKMLFYNSQLTKAVQENKHLKTGDKLEEYQKNHVNLENQIKEWKKTAKLEYDNIKKWETQSQSLHKEKQVLENQIAKLKMLYQEQYELTEKILIDSTTGLEQYIIHNVITVIDFLHSINQYIDEELIVILRSVSTLINSVENKKIEAKQKDFEQIYEFMSKIQPPSYLEQQFRDILHHFKKYLDTHRAFRTLVVDHNIDSKLSKNILELVQYQTMIDKNSDILKVLQNKQRSWK